MANQSRYRPSRATRLHLEGIERRDLLSAMPSLLNPLFSAHPTSIVEMTGSQAITAVNTLFGNVGSGTVAATSLVPDHLLVMPAVDTSVAGAPFDVTVTIQDAYGNTVTDYTGTVTFSSADPYGASLPADYTFTAADAGVHTFSASASLYTAGTWDITAIDTVTGITGSASVTVTPAALDHLVITPSAAMSMAGAPFDVTVTVQDAYSNTATDYTGTVTFSSADPYGASLPPDYTFTAADAGVHTFSASATLYTAGTWDITASDAAIGITGSASVTITPAALDQLVITPSVAVSMAGTPFDITVTVQDAYGNTVTDYTGTVTFSSADPYGAGLPADYTFTAADAGVHTFSASASLYTAGTWDITASDPSSGISGSASVAVTPAAASHFAIQIPSSAVAGTPFDITILALDPYGNVDTNYVTDPSGVVHFSATDSDGRVVLPADYQFTAADQGRIVFAGGVTLFTPGNQSLMAVDTASGLTDDGNASISVTDPTTSTLGGGGTDGSSRVSVQSDASVGSYDAVGMHSNSVVSSVQQSIPRTISIAATNNAESISLSYSTSATIVSSNNTTSSSDLSARSGSAEQTTPEGSNSRDKAAEARTDPARDFSPISGRDTAPSHTDYGADWRRPPANAQMVVSSTVPSDPQNRNGERAIHGSDLKFATSTMARPASSSECLATAIAARSDRGENRGEAGPVAQASEDEDSSVSASAQSVGLLGSPLHFNLDSLAREAQQFFSQIDRLSQDLVGMLASMNALPWSVAVATAFTASVVVRRRRQRAQRKPAVPSRLGTAVAGFPELGGTWSWEES